MLLMLLMLVMIDGRRYARRSQRRLVRLLPGAVHRRHVHGPHTSSDSLLRIQPHHPVRPHLVDGSAHLHAAA